MSKRLSSDARPHLACLLAFVATASLAGDRAVGAILQLEDQTFTVFAQSTDSIHGDTGPTPILTLPGFGSANSTFIGPSATDYVRLEVARRSPYEVDLYLSIGYNHTLQARADEDPLTGRVSRSLKVWVEGAYTIAGALAADTISSLRQDSVYQHSADAVADMSGVLEEARGSAYVGYSDGLGLSVYRSSSIRDREGGGLVITESGSGNPTTVAAANGTWSFAAQLSMSVDVTGGGSYPERATALAHSVRHRLTVTPEPASLTLLSLGALALRRGRRKTCARA